ncbi:MAG: tRNA dimethylallyltransferase, partial [Acidimicrobiia bacterium]
DPEVREELDTRPSFDNVDELRRIDPDADRHVDITNPRRVVRALEVYRLTGNTPSERAASKEAEAIKSYQPLFEFSAVGLDPGAQLADRIARRLSRMLNDGFLNEVRQLAPRLGRTASQAVGYKQLLPVVHGVEREDAGVAEAIRATLRLAKHQRTYFHRDPRISWVPWSDDPDALYGVVRSIFEEAAE